MKSLAKEKLDKQLAIWRQDWRLYRHRERIVAGEGVVSDNNPQECLVNLRPYQRDDRADVTNLLAILPSLYPKGDEWLDRRLDDVLRGRARCTVAVIKRKPVGVTIETPKGRSKLKLSTIFVHQQYRGLGVGSCLMYRCHETWVMDNLSQVHLTSDVRIGSALLPLLKSFGFKSEILEYSRYGSGRDEQIHVWKNNGVVKKVCLCNQSIGNRQFL
jgi:GNAT superfamily N-acetyltransferase